MLSGGSRNSARRGHFSSEHTTQLNCAANSLNNVPEQEPCKGDGEDGEGVSQKKWGGRSGKGKGSRQKFSLQSNTNACVCGISPTFPLSLCPVTKYRQHFVAQRLGGALVSFP